MTSRRSTSGGGGAAAAAAAIRRVMAESQSYSLTDCTKRGDLVHSGELLKQSDYFKVWRQRYFVVLRNPPRLLYYYSGKLSAPAKVISLHRAQVSLSPGSGGSGERSGFSVHMPTTGVSLYFTSDDPQRIRAWVTAIGSLGDNPATTTTTNGTTTTTTTTTPRAASNGGSVGPIVSPIDSTSTAATGTGTGTGSGSGSGSGIGTTKQHRRAFSSVLTPKHVLTPITSRVSQRQELRLPLYGSRAEVMDALDNHFIIVFLPKTHGGTTLELHIERVHTRAERITFDASLSLDGVHCVCKCEIDLTSLIGAALVTTAVDDASTRQTRMHSD